MSVSLSQPKVHPLPPAQSELSCQANKIKEIRSHHSPSSPCTLYLFDTQLKLLLQLITKGYRAFLYGMDFSTSYFYIETSTRQNGFSPFTISLFTYSFHSNCYGLMVIFCYFICVQSIWFLIFTHSVKHFVTIFYKVLDESSWLLFCVILTYLLIKESPEHW